MIATKIQEITAKHLEAWYANPGGDTLRQHVADAITEALAEQDKLWQAGNTTLRHERDMALGRLRAVEAGLSFSAADDTDLETCARRHYHGHIDAVQALKLAEARIEEQARKIVDLEFAARGYAAKVKANERPQEL